MRYFLLTIMGTALTLFCTFLVFYFSPTPLPLSEQLWYMATCVVCVLLSILTYRGQPRDLSQPLPLVVRGLAVAIMVLSGGAWAWLLVQTVVAEDSHQWAIRVQRTLALFLFAGAYYIAAQKPRRR